MSGTHGNPSTYNSGCRCPDCTDAHRIRMKRLRKARALHLRADTTLAPHGLASTYNNWGCRCEPCTAAHVARCREYKIRTGRQQSGRSITPDTAGGASGVGLSESPVRLGQATPNP